MEKITVEVLVNAPVSKVWQYFTEPEHIVVWNHASDDWHTTRAENDLVVGGKLTSRMEAKDGSSGFDFEGTYDEVVVGEKLSFTMPDGRKVSVTFQEKDGQTAVVETFDPETENTIELQRSGWQAILDNFKKHVEQTA
jgi:uncharacterized protein YndB with AHSA1/START domain